MGTQHGDGHRVYMCTNKPGYRHTPLGLRIYSRRSEIVTDRNVPVLCWCIKKKEGNMIFSHQNHNKREGDMKPVVCVYVVGSLVSLVAPDTIAIRCALYVCEYCSCNYYTVAGDACTSCTWMVSSGMRGWARAGGMHTHPGGHPCASTVTLFAFILCASACVFEQITNLFHIPFLFVEP